jgi:hypothetical protein
MHSNSRARDLSKAAPRSGRERLGQFAWLGRMTDKARAKRAGTLGEYLSLCPLDRGFLQRLGVTEDTFLELILAGLTDDEIATYFDRHVSPVDRDRANHWVLVDMADFLDQQDREERQAAA